MHTTLKKVIGQFLNSADQSSHQFLRLWTIGKFGLETEFNLDLTGTFRTVILDVTANKSVNLPCDYISYKKIGLMNGIGEVVTLKRNDQLSKLNRNTSTEMVRAGASFPAGFYPYNDAYYNNYFYEGVSYKLYGANSGTVVRGTYTEDKLNGILLLNKEFDHPQIVLEYLSDGYQDGNVDDHVIDIRAAKAMLAYIRWQNSVDQPKKFSQTTIGAQCRDFYREKRLARMRLNPFVLNEMQAITHESSKLVAKS